MARNPLDRLLLDRRQLLGATGSLLGATALGGLGLPVRRALAGASGSQLKFIFVVNYGGWDPTRVFATEFDNPFVDMERDAELGQLGDLSFVDHEDRPNVRAFFEQHHARALILNGVLVPSIAHENCLRISLTGSTAQDRSDWGAILAGSAASGYALPQVVVGGPSFPGEFGTFVTRTGTGGQVGALLTGDIAQWSDVAVGRPDWRAEDVMDSYIRRRAAAAAESATAGREAELRLALARSIERGQGLKDLVHDVNWDSASTFGGQVDVAVDLLRLQVSRVATLSFSYYGWDTHVYNDSYQSTNFNQLFGELSDLMDALAAAPGEFAETLADETVVVVLSEMGRTPQLNSADGKDHWPYTSVMVVGPGVLGGRVVGGYDEYYYGRTIDPATGELAEDATNLSADVVGATLLTLADIDSEDFVSGVTPIKGVLT